MNLDPDKNSDPIAFIRDEAPPVPEVRLDLQILQSLRRIIRAADLFSKKLVKQHKITNPQLVCLHRIMQSEGLTIAELSKSVYLSASTIVGIIDRLEERGLVQRARSQSDRRKVLIHATQAGRDLVMDAPSPLQQALQSGLKSMDQQEQQAISDSLDKLVSMLELSEIDAAPLLETGQLMTNSPASPSTDGTNSKQTTKPEDG